ncbi:mucin-5AC-like [Gymnodraco acuticeps]|uniref:Mucin-5AC-like n=1 Tax=Gymnodraco acuticeps TaxID=8218 RepID=A0A6P8UX95_GYMAC|nr:mucin-5AC-like [Gymnodraco acuticeps]
MRNLLVGVFLGLLAVVHSTPVHTTTQIPVKAENEVIREALTDEYIIEQSLLPTLTTKSPKRNTTVQQITDTTQESAKGASMDHISTSTILPEDTQDNISDSTTTPNRQLSFTSSEEPNEAKSGVTATHITVPQTTDLTTAFDIAFRSTLSSESGSGDGEMFTQQPTTTPSMTSGSGDGDGEMFTQYPTTTPSMTSGSGDGDGEMFTQYPTTTSSMTSGSGDGDGEMFTQYPTTTSSMTSGSGDGDGEMFTQYPTTTSSMTSGSGDGDGEMFTQYPTTTSSMTSGSGDGDGEMFTQYPTTTSSMTSGSGDGEMFTQVLTTTSSPSTSMAGFIAPRMFAGSEGSGEGSGSDIENSGIVLINETPSKQEPLRNSENNQIGLLDDPATNIGHSTPGWIIIVGFIVGLAALIVLFVAIATRDKWNAPSQASETKSSSSNQQKEIEMKTFLHKDNPRENGTAGEYTVIPLEELPEPSSH